MCREKALKEQLKAAARNMRSIGDRNYHDSQLGESTLGSAAGRAVEESYTNANLSDEEGSVSGCFAIDAKKKGIEKQKSLEQKLKRYTNQVVNARTDNAKIYSSRQSSGGKLVIP